MEEFVLAGSMALSATILAGHSTSILDSMLAD